ncbi:unnamed protein product [Ixodes persulcatus]
MGPELSSPHKPAVANASAEHVPDAKPSAAVALGPSPTASDHGGLEPSTPTTPQASPSDNHRPRRRRLTTLIKQERQCFPLLLANCLKYLKNIKYS